MPVGTGTLVNVLAILVGSAVGVAFGERLPGRTRELVTDVLGLVTILVAALSSAAVLEPSLRDAVGSGAPVLIVLGSLLLGGIAGSLLHLEGRLDRFGSWLRRRLSRADSADAADAGERRDGGDAQAGDHRFVEGFVTASLVFCVGPLAILGPLSDGLGNGIEQLALKSVLDLFAAIAFAAALGWGVAASALAVLAYQGLWTVVGVALGGVLPPEQIAVLTAVGGVLLAGVGLRLLRIRQIAVADLLPALLVAPVLTAVVSALR